MILGEPKQAPKDPNLDPHENRSTLYHRPISVGSLAHYSNIAITDTESRKQLAVKHGKNVGKSI
jgi:hypothetical protein